jgi:PPK2 family polyphosphate:nucleotide phosphotransferase
MGTDSDQLDLNEIRRTLLVGPTFRLADIDPDSAPGFPGNRSAGGSGSGSGTGNGAVSDKDLGEDLFDDRDDEIADLQERMWARARVGAAGAPSLLLVLQGMDAAGKGGIVRHVFGAVDPQGLQIASFKRPTEEELSHDFLWRIRKRLPAPGFIGIFDRSHYEDVLVQRVRSMAPAEEIERRYGAIVDFERDLVASGTRILKFMLHVGRDEQEVRLRERIERPDKHWKYNPGDIDERSLWSEYAEAYEIAVRRTSTERAPWWVVPANKKWYARLLVKAVLLQTLRGMRLEWPEADFDKEVEKVRLKAS